MRRWSALSYDQLISRLSTVDVYEVEDDFKKYQVEIEILENTEEYVHVAVSVDDGH
jgi:predicted metal-dependent hydrolase